MFSILCFHHDTLTTQKPAIPVTASRIQKMKFSVLTCLESEGEESYIIIQEHVCDSTNPVHSPQEITVDHMPSWILFTWPLKPNSWFSSYLSPLCKIFLNFPILTCGMPSGFSPWPSSFYTHNLGDLPQLHSIKYYLCIDNSPSLYPLFWSFHWNENPVIYLMPSFNYLISIILLTHSTWILNFLPLPRRSDAPPKIFSTWINRTTIYQLLRWQRVSLQTLTKL